jgi:hypothetical protein
LNPTEDGSLIVEVHETDYPGGWYLRIEWYGKETIYAGFATAGDAINKALRVAPEDVNIKAEIVPYIT